MVVFCPLKDHSVYVSASKDRAPLVAHPPDLNGVLSQLSFQDVDFKPNILQEQLAMSRGCIVFLFKHECITQQSMNFSFPYLKAISGEEGRGRAEG